MMKTAIKQKVRWLVAHIKKEGKCKPSNAVEAHAFLMEINNPEKED